MILSVLRQCKDTLLNFFYPLRCQGCRRYLPASPVEHVCPDCRDILYKSISKVCVVCCKEAPETASVPFTCKTCATRKKPELIFLHAGLYTGLLKDLIKTMKYVPRQFITDTLGEYLCTFIDKQNIDMSLYACILPVPLSRVRMRERGFNQAECIAHYMNRRYTIPVNTSVLKRKNHRHPQASLNRKERLTNVATVFSAKKDPSLEGASVILLDDVRSTGSTLYYCAQTLFSMGVKHVLALTVAFNK
ncbi:MAG: hypothetical protein AB1454_12020 [Candidatus Auribacterota bacterium]